MGQRKTEKEIVNFKLNKIAARWPAKAVAQFFYNLIKSSGNQVLQTGQFKLPKSTEAGMIYGGCNCGNCHITISSNGDIMACRRVTDSKVANIFEDRLADVWICQMEKYRDYDKFVKCSKCELKAWCRGCPAVANGTSGNFYGADPQCWKTRNEITGEILEER